METSEKHFRWHGVVGAIARGSRIEATDAARNSAVDRALGVGQRHQHFGNVDDLYFSRCAHLCSQVLLL